MTPSSDIGFFARLWPKAERLQDFGLDESDLPKRAIPFIWVFVRALGLAFGIQALLYAAGATLFAFEPLFFGRLVSALEHGNVATGWHDAGRILIGYLLIVQFGGRLSWQLGHFIESHSFPVLTMLIRRRLATYLHSHSYRYFQEDFAGRLAGKVVEMPQAVEDTINDVLSYLLTISISGLISIILFMRIDGLFALTAIIYFIANILFYRWRVPKLTVKADVSAATRQVMRGRYLDGITNILLVKLFARERHEDRLFSSALIDAGLAEQAQQREGVYLWRGQHTINGLFQGGIMALGFWLYTQGRITTGDLATVLTLGLSLAYSMWQILRLAIRFFGRFAIIEEALATILQPTEIKDSPVAAGDPLGAGDLRFDNVAFSYPGHPVFRRFSLDIPAGQKLGLIGPSGAGKSTFMQLALRLFDVDGGAIRIGGQDIREVPQSRLREAVAVIPQATDLMHRSIADNIRYGRLGATDEEVMAAARKAFIHETIMGLTDQNGNRGYQASVGERGVKLSGGQKQRIAIARAFLKDAPFLILDEATSALDSESEELIQRSFAELFRGRTVIVIAHRLSTISHLERIVVLQSGEIVEDGPHQTLLDQGGLYARLWSLQSAGFLPSA